MSKQSTRTLSIAGALAARYDVSLVGGPEGDSILVRHSDEAAEALSILPLYDGTTDYTVWKDNGEHEPWRNRAQTVDRIIAQADYAMRHYVSDLTL